MDKKKRSKGWKSSSIHFNYWEVLRIYAENEMYYTTENGEHKKAIVLKLECKDKNILEKIASEYDVELMKCSPEYAPEIVHYCFVIK